MKIDLNADMGESFGLYKMGHDEAFMKFITGANVACGFHAGDSAVMRKTVAWAKRDGVQVGAHPGLPDLQGFGRREMNLSPDEVYEIVLYQAGALKAFVEAAGMRLHHVKPHGSLYGMAHRREEIARAVCQAVKDLDPALYLYVMHKGVIGEMAARMGVRCVFELYADLDYDAQGNLVITRVHEAHEPGETAAKVVRMVREGKVKALDGSDLSIFGTSVCVHSDTPGAFEVVKALRQALEESGCEIVSPAL